ncbi:hypothetical protein LJR290_006936 [Variovorax sp. LjRoot290]
MSVKDIHEMRTAIASLSLQPLSITYMVGSADHRSLSRELLITNF